MFNSRKTDYSISKDNNALEALKKMFRGGVDRQFGIQRYKLVYVELTDNKVLIYGSGNYIQYPVINHTHIYPAATNINLECSFSTGGKAVTGKSKILRVLSY